VVRRRRENQNTRKRNLRIIKRFYRGKRSTYQTKLRVRLKNKRRRRRN